MNKLQQQRKDEHLHLAEKFYQPQSSFSGIRFVHQSLPESDLASTDLSTTYGALQFSAPFFINAMTGGSAHTKQINQRLARIAKETGLAMATGSLSAAIKDASLSDTFTIVRKENPTGLILANIGAEHSIEAAKRAVDLLEADALQVHINVAQELTMPEGARSFHWLNNIEKMVNQIHCPVIVKEVGFGMSRETARQLHEIGVTYLDVSGKGGTNFAQIENSRGNDWYQELNDWGMTTAESLLDLQTERANFHLTASGGIHSPLDVAKCLALGADLVGVSGYFLHYLLHHSDEEVIAEIKRWQSELRVILTLVGCKEPHELSQQAIVIDESLSHWCTARGIDWQALAQRTIMR